jgi:hypothetical protein
LSEVRVRRILICGLLVVAIAFVANQTFGNPPVIERCERYQPAGQPLIAHAGGGLPNAIYTNRLEAMELAAKHGFKLIELDFWRTTKGIALGHDPNALSPTSFDQLLDFLRRHPDIMIVTDFKTDNVYGLRRIAELAGPMKGRFIPQLYSLDEYQPAVDLGFPRPIFTAYRGWSIGWLFRVNKVPVRAVTMPYNQRYLAGLVDHPVYLNTVNQPKPGYGLYTDCLIPAPAA